MKRIMLLALLLMVGPLYCASSEPGGGTGPAGKESAGAGRLFTPDGAPSGEVRGPTPEGHVLAMPQALNPAGREDRGNETASVDRKPEEREPRELKPEGRDKPRGLPVEAEEAIWKRVGDARPAEVEKPDDLTEGQMRVTTKEGKVMCLPLAHTSVEAEVSGMLGRVWVTQYFTNPYDHAIEAIYVFPLPSMAAVDDMEMHVGDRVVRGLMKKRDEARQIYEDAKRQGKTASLLEQERPNIFTQSVANILPGDRIKVRIRYVEDMKYEDGGYEFVFPMVVGPRFIPGSPTGQQGGGWAPDTDRVPDASRITPPVLKPGQRSGHDIDVTLEINAGVEIQELKSPSHDLDVKELDDNVVRATLKPYDTIPNKDLIVKYKTAGKQLQVANLFHASQMGNYFMLVFQPQAAPKDDDVVPRELVFVVDCSGSMSGMPLSKVKEAMKKALKAMRPDDAFQIFKFSESAHGFAPAPVPNTTENLKRALQFIDQLYSEGGTQMIEGIKAALDYPEDPKRMRIVAFMTDGYIGNDNEILAAVKDKVGKARLFSFGIGSSVNRYLLDGMAKAGRGAVTYVRQDEPADEAVTRFYRRIDSPVLSDIEVKVDGDVKLSEVNPSPILDLFAGQPLVVHGKYEGTGKASFVISGRQGSRDFEQEIDVDFPDDEPDNGVLATLWARTKIEYLMGKMLNGEDNDIVEQVTDLAIKFRIMSKYTSFVAVEEQVRRKGDKIETVQVPVEIPEGVSYEGIFGREQGGDMGGVGGLMQVPAAAPPAGPMRMMRAKKAEEKAAFWGAAGSAAPAETEALAEEPVGDEDDRKDGAKATAADKPVVAPSCGLTADAVTILEGPLTEKQVLAALKAKLEKIADDLEAALAADGTAIRDLTIEVSLKVDAAGQVTVKSVTVRQGSAAVRSGTVKSFEKHFSAVSFGAESSATLVKLTFKASCR